MDSTNISGGLSTDAVSLTDAIGRNMIVPDVKSWRFLEEEAPLIDFINSSAVNDKTMVSVASDIQLPVSFLLSHDFPTEKFAQ